MNIKKYVVYFHKNPETGKIFYVGIGIEKRAYCFYNRGNFWLNYVNKHGEPIVRIVCKKLTREQAAKKEIFYIKKYGRIVFDKNGILVNITLGGDGGTLGVKPKKKTLLKKSNSMKVYYKNNKHPMSGKKHSKKTKKLISKKRIAGNYKGINHPLYGKKRSKEVKEKLRMANIGKKHTEKTKAKLRAYIKNNGHPMQGKKHSKFSKKKMSIAHKGKVLSKQHRLNISIAGKRRYFYA